MVEPPVPNQGVPEPERGRPHQASEPPTEPRPRRSAGVLWMVAAVVLAVAVGWLVWALVA